MLCQERVTQIVCLQVLIRAYNGLHDPTFIINTVESPDGVGNMTLASNFGYYDLFLGPDNSL